MSNENVALNEAKDELVKLIDKLYESKHNYERATDRAAGYLGNDQVKEQNLENRTTFTESELRNVKLDIASKIDLIKELVAKY